MNSGASVRRMICRISSVATTRGMFSRWARSIASDVLPTPLAPPPDENYQRLVEVSPRPPDLVALLIVHAVPFPEQAGDELLQFPVRYVSAPAVYQLGLDVPGDFERLVRRQAGSLDRVGQHFPGERPAADGNAHGPRFPENEVAHQLVLVMSGEQLPDDAGDLLFVDIRFLAQGRAHIIRQLVGLIVIEAELNQVMHEHPPHEGDAPLAVDYCRHAKRSKSRETVGVKYSYVVVCGKYTSTSAGWARSVPGGRAPGLPPDGEAGNPLLPQGAAGVCEGGLQAGYFRN